MGRGDLRVIFQDHVVERSVEKGRLDIYTGYYDICGKGTEWDYGFYTCRRPPELPSSRRLIDQGFPKGNPLRRHLREYGKIRVLANFSPGSGTKPSSLRESLIFD